MDATYIVTIQLRTGDCIDVQVDAPSPGEAQALAVQTRRRQPTGTAVKTSGRRQAT